MALKPLLKKVTAESYESYGALHIMIDEARLSAPAGLFISARKNPSLAILCRKMTLTSDTILFLFVLPSLSLF